MPIAKKKQNQSFFETTACQSWRGFIETQCIVEYNKNFHSFLRLIYVLIVALVTRICFLIFLRANFSKQPGDVQTANLLQYSLDDAEEQSCKHALWIINSSVIDLAFSSGMVVISSLYQFQLGLIVFKVSIRFYSALTKTAPFKSINQSINQSVSLLDVIDKRSDGTSNNSVNAEKYQ